MNNANNVNNARNKFNFLKISASLQFLLLKWRFLKVDFPANFGYLIINFSIEQQVKLFFWIGLEKVRNDLDSIEQHFGDIERVIAENRGNSNCIIPSKC